MAGISSSEASAGSMGVSSMMIGVHNKYCFPKSKVERNSKQRHTRTPPQKVMASQKSKSFLEAGSSSSWARAFLSLALYQLLVLRAKSMMIGRLIHI
jgi:hypothetical protein